MEFHFLALDDCDKSEVTNKNIKNCSGFENNKEKYPVLRMV